MTRPDPRPPPAPSMLAGAMLAACALACSSRDPSVARRVLYFAGEQIAHIEERVHDAGPGRRVTRISTLEDTGESTVLEATLDAQGFALAARYTRGRLRAVELSELPELAAAGAGQRLVLIDLLAHVQPTAPAEVALIDLASAEVIVGRIERRGAEIVALDRFGGVVARANVEGHRTGPGVFFEGDTAPATPRVPVEIAAVAPRGVAAWRLLGVGDVLPALGADGPGQRRAGDLVVRRADPSVDPPGDGATASQPFIESADVRVVAWATSLGAPDDPLARAVRLVEAIHPMAAADKRALPPAAVVMLEHGGDCDGAAALLVAGLRALGTPARPVVGYRWAEGRFVPHAWVEVHTPAGWVLADASAPRIGDDPTYLKLFDGLGGALTMGRVLGRLQLEPATQPGVP